MLCIKMLFVFITWLLEADKLAGNNESILNWY